MRSSSPASADPIPPGPLDFPDNLPSDHHTTTIVQDTIAAKTAASPSPGPPIVTLSISSTRSSEPLLSSDELTDLEEFSEGSVHQIVRTPRAKAKGRKGRKKKNEE